MVYNFSVSVQVIKLFIISIYCLHVILIHMPALPVKSQLCNRCHIDAGTCILDLESMHRVNDTRDSLFIIICTSLKTSLAPLSNLYQRPPPRPSISHHPPTLSHPTSTQCPTMSSKTSTSPAPFRTCTSASLTSGLQGRPSI